MELKIEKSKLEEAYKVATPEIKQMFEVMFGVENCKPMMEKPTLDNYKTIKSYKDACIALQIPTIHEPTLIGAGVSKKIISLIKLETISHALWGRNYQPKPDTKGESYFFFPRFFLYTYSDMVSRDIRV